MPNKQSITLHNKISDTGKLFDFFSQYVKALNIPEEAYNDLRLVLEETFVNIASYAYEGEDEQSIDVELSNSEDEIHITFTDSGTAFDPLAYSVDSIETGDHCDGGMGIHIIRSLTDDQEYGRVGQSNVFTVTKHYTR